MYKKKRCYFGVSSAPEDETVAMVIQPEEIDLSSSFFMGVQILV